MQDILNDLSPNKMPCTCVLMQYLIGSFPAAANENSKIKTCGICVCS